MDAKCKNCPFRLQAKFKKPTIEEITAYAKEIGYTSFDVEYYYATQEKLGWVVKLGNSWKPMASWKGSIRTWYLAAKRRGEVGEKKPNLKERYEQEKKENA